MTLEIDLQAPTIPNDRRVWRLFPGSGYQFWEDFHEQDVGYLDFPGLELPKNVKLTEAPDLIARIARSQQIKNYLWSNGPEAKLPDFDLKKFADARHTQNRGRLRQALINFYEVAAAGDYVILPEPLYLSNVWVGRISSKRIVKGRFPHRYGANSIPARQITWLAKHKENTISSALSLMLRHQHPFTLLERSLFVEVFSLAHGSFVYRDRHAATVYNDKDDYLDSDAALLGAISRLSAAALMSVDKGEKGLTAEDFTDILLRSPPIEYTCTQEADIHSPGFNRYIAGTAVALVISAVTASLIGLSYESSKAQLANDVGKLVFLNSAPDADPLCTAKVSEAAARVLKALGTDRTWELCKAARAASERAGIRASAAPKNK